MTRRGPNFVVGADNLVREDHDERVIVWSNATEIDYVQYKLRGVEVARLTLTYDINGNVTRVLKTSSV